jgi:hypothetical protein
MKHRRTAAAGLAVAVILVLVGLAVAGCGSGVPDDAVALVGDVPLTKAQFDKYMDQAKATVMSQSGSFPAEGSAEYDQYAASLVDYMVENEVIAQGAGKLGVEVTDVDVSLYIAELETSYGGHEAFLEELADGGTTFAEVRKDVRASLLGEAVHNAVIADVEVTAAEVKAFWEENKAAYIEAAQKEDKVATFANTKKKIRASLLEAARAQAWQTWIDATADELGVLYAEGYDPDTLAASPSPSAGAAQ